MTDQTQTPPGTAPIPGEVVDFLVDLSAAFQKHSMYPPGHPALAPVAESVEKKLSRILKERGTLSVGAGRDHLIIEGVQTGASHPLLHALAERLHRHELGAISFAEGVSREEIADVLSLIAEDPDRSGSPLGRQSEDVLKGRRHVRLQPLDFERLRIAETGLEAGSHQEQERDLWTRLVEAILGNDDGSVDAAEADLTRLTQAIAARAEDGRYVQEVAQRLGEIARHLAGVAPYKPSELRKAISGIVKRLPTDTLRRLLRAQGNRTERLAFADRVAMGLQPDAALEVVKAEAAEDRYDISVWMTLLLSKLARHAMAEGWSGRKQSDERVRDHLRQLISEWNLENPNPADYEQNLSQLTLDVRPVPAVALAIAEPEAERTVQMSLETGTAGECLVPAVDVLLESGDVSTLVSLAAAAPTGPAGPNDAAQLVWERLARPAVVRGLLDEEGLDFDTLDAILPHVGVAAAEPLFDCLATAAERSTRRKAFDRLASLGSEVGPLALEKIDGPDEPPWYFVRNILSLVNALPEAPSSEVPARYRGHENDQVRLEAYKLCMKMDAERERTIVEALADPQPRAVALAVAEVERACPAAAEPGLRRIALDQEAQSALRVQAIRVLGGRDSRESLDVLLQLSKPRRRLLGLRPPPESPELGAALKALRARWAEEPDAARALKVARKSRSREIQEAAT